VNGFVQIINLLRDRILAAATTPLSLSGWLGLYGAIALPFGWLTQFL
jgi:predicted Abi (CAAX) family protease